MPQNRSHRPLRICLGDCAIALSIILYFITCTGIFGNSHYHPLVRDLITFGGDGHGDADIYIEALGELLVV